MKATATDDYLKIAEQLKNKNFSQVYLLYGEEVYLRNQYRQKLISALSAPDDTMNVAYYSGKDISEGNIIDLAETMPFLAERRLIVIDDSGFCKNASDKIADYLGGDIAETTIILFTESDVDKRNKVFKTIEKKGMAVDFTRQTEKTLFLWVSTKLRSVNKTMAQSVFRLFLEKTGDDMERMNTELEKLICFAWDRTEITASDVNAMCTEQLTDRIFEMVRAIGEKKTRRALDLYYDLLALKNTPFQILYMINRQFSMLLTMKDLSGKGMPANLIAERMKMRDFAVKQNLNQTRQFTLKQLEQALRDGVQTEQDAKSGRLDAQLGVEMLILKYSSTESAV